MSKNDSNNSSGAYQGKPLQTQKPAKFCPQCGSALGANGDHVHKASVGRGEKWAKRLKTWGGAMSGLFSMFFYLFLISVFLGGGGLLGGGANKPSEKLYGSGEEKIAVVDISGIILEEEPGDGLGFAGGAATTSRGLIKTFEQIKEDENVKAVVLRVNSPGGSVTASEEIYQLVNRFKQETKMPVIVSQGDTAASGGYYVSLAGDEIISDPTTLTGSIGVILQTINFKGLADKLGVEGVVITSGKNKDLLNPFKKIEQEDKEILQELIDDAQEQFVLRIIQARNIKRSKLLPIADGRVLSGKQAKDAGLVDRLGNFNDAIDLAKQKAGLVEASVVVFGKKGLLESLLGVIGNKISLTSGMPFSYLQFLNGRLAYLYLP